MKRTVILMGAAACMILTNADAKAEDSEAAQAEEVKQDEAPEKQKKVKVPKVKKPKAAKVRKVKGPKVKKEKAPKVKKEKASKPVAEEMKIAGVIVKEEKQKKEGGKVQVKYVLTSSEGIKIALPKLKKPRKPKNGEKPAPAKKMDDYVGAGVTVIAKGLKKKKDGKEVILLNEIIDIQKSGNVAEIDIFKNDGE